MKISTYCKLTGKNILRRVVLNEGEVVTSTDNMVDIEEGMVIINRIHSTEEVDPFDYLGSIISVYQFIDGKLKCLVDRKISVSYIPMSECNELLNYFSNYDHSLIYDIVNLLQLTKEDAELLRSKSLEGRLYV